MVIFCDGKKKQLYSNVKAMCLTIKVSLNVQPKVDKEKRLTEYMQDILASSKVTKVRKAETYC